MNNKTPPVDSEALFTGGYYTIEVKHKLYGYKNCNRRHDQCRQQK